MKYKYIIIIAIIVLVLAYGLSWGYKKYTVLKEQAAINVMQAEIQADLEKADLEHARTEEELYRRLNEKNQQISNLNAQVDRLEAALHNIVVPSDPDDLVNAWGKVGIRASRRTIEPGNLPSR